MKTRAMHKPVKQSEINTSCNVFKTAIEKSTQQKSKCHSQIGCPQAFQFQSSSRSFKGSPHLISWTILCRLSMYH